MQGMRGCPAFAFGLGRHPLDGASPAGPGGTATDGTRPVGVRIEAAGPTGSIIVGGVLQEPRQQRWPGQVRILVVLGPEDGAAQVGAFETCRGQVGAGKGPGARGPVRYPEVSVPQVGSASRAPSSIAALRSASSSLGVFQLGAPRGPP